MTYVNAQIEAEDIVGQMLEDGEFAQEMWLEIAELLSRGRLLDDCMDITATGFTTDQKEMFRASLTQMAASLTGQIDFDLQK